ncbi:MAG: PocR ligand-binding domain-containing protein [Clostridia bacterium]|nr:PocR ligand-binding domain-containing protein [Clostridia bacterium]
MISVFDAEKLRGLLKDFYEISRIRITVFDENMNELLAFPPQVAPYCAVIRESTQGLRACRNCDRQACGTAAEKKKTHIYRCHAGLIEAVTPLYVGDMPIGYLLFGHVFPYASCEAGMEEILRHCDGLPVNREKLKEAVLQAVPMEEKYVRSAAHILHAVASFLIMEHMATLREDLLEVRLDAYISAHYTEQLNAARLSRELGIGKTQLYSLTKRLYRQGTAARIRELRMEKARTLLLKQPALSLAEVAWQCGYPDYNYFFTVFKRETGCTPRAWRSGRAGIPGPENENRD